MPLAEFQRNHDRADLLERQRCFLADTGLTLAWDLFCHLNQVGFFVKNREGRFVLVSPSLARCLGGIDCLEFVDRTDHDYFLPEMVDAYRMDDERVIEEGDIREKSEMLAPLCGEPRRVTTTKYPVTGSGGEIVGVAGVVRCGASASGDREFLPLAQDSQISKIVSHAWRHPDLRPGDHAIAALVSEPVEVLRRNFRHWMGCSPAEFYQAVIFRMISRDISTTTIPIGEIGEKFGYRSASAFTARFRELSGETPTRFRRRWHHRRSGEAV